MSTFAFVMQSNAYYMLDMATAYDPFTRASSVDGADVRRWGELKIHPLQLRTLCRSRVPQLLMELLYYEKKKKVNS